jgi:hypothetical protein
MKRGHTVWIRARVTYCRGKIRHEKMRDAVAALKFQNRFRGRHGRGKQLHIYECPHCGGWHLTHQQKL